MDMNITHSIDQPLFYASVTNGQPPRLSVCFTPGGGFKKDGIDCPGSVVAKAGRQIRISLEDKTVLNEAAADLATVHDCGRSLAFRQIRAGAQTAYFYEDDNEQVEGVSLSQVTLQVRNASLVAAFTTGAAEAGVAPVMPGALAAAQEVREAVPEELIQDNSVLQEKLKAIAAHDKLTFNIPQGELVNFLPSFLPSLFPQCLNQYQVWRSMLISQPHLHNRLQRIPTYQMCLQAEKDYLAQQARNDYNAGILS